MPLQDMDLQARHVLFPRLGMVGLPWSRRGDGEGSQMSKKWLCATITLTVTMLFALPHAVFGATEAPAIADGGRVLQDADVSAEQGSLNGSYGEFRFTSG